jgi:hypothetical protein
MRGTNLTELLNIIKVTLVFKLVFSTRIHIVSYYYQKYKRPKPRYLPKIAMFFR